MAVIVIPVLVVSIEGDGTVDKTVVANGKEATDV